MEVIIQDSQFTVLPEHTTLQVPAGAEVVLLDQHGQSDIVVEVGEGAKVAYILALHEESAGKRKAVLAAQASITWYSAIYSPKANLEVVSEHQGNGSESNHNGVFLGKQRDRYALRYWSDHIAEHTAGHINVHGALLDNSYADFVGNIRIAETARHTDGSLDEHTLLLGERSRSDSIPQLEIDTNEVAASHSSSITRIDDEQLFYLQSRGLPADLAKYMIVRGFLEGIVDEFPNEKIRKQVYTYIEEVILPKLAVS